MDTIGVVPKHAEVFCRGFEICHSLHHFIRKRNARRVGIFGNAPNTFDACVVFDKCFHHIHIRTVRQHRHGDHIYTEVFANGKMPIVSGRGTNKFDLVKLIPRCRTHYAELKCELHHVIHNVERRAFAYDNLVRLYSENVGKQFSCLF